MSSDNLPAFSGPHLIVFKGRSLFTPEADCPDRLLDCPFSTGRTSLLVNSCGLLSSMSRVRVEGTWQKSEYITYNIQWRRREDNNIIMKE